MNVGGRCFALVVSSLEQPDNHTMRQTKVEQASDARHTEALDMVWRPFGRQLDRQGAPILLQLTRWCHRTIVSQGLRALQGVQLALQNVQLALHDVQLASVALVIAGTQT